MTLNDLERLCKIFNDTKRRAASLRQLSFFFIDTIMRWHRNLYFNSCALSYW